MRRTELKRGRRQSKVTPGGYTHEQFHEAAREQYRCAVTGIRGAWQPHHVIEQQEITRRGGDIYDPRNALRLALRAHERHTLAVRRVRASELKDCNIDFAFELMGRGAYPYLMRMYDGTDTRIELAIAELEV